MPENRSSDQLAITSSNGKSSNGTSSNGILSHTHEPSQTESTVGQLQARLAQVERLAAIGELTSTTTHEFNNLLMTILNYAKMGLRNKDEASRDKAFTRILDAANRGAKITSTVLGLARNRSGEMEPTNLVPLIQDTLVLLERELQKYRVAVETQFEEVPNVMDVEFANQR